MQSMHPSIPQKKGMGRPYLSSFEFRLSRSKLELFLICSRCFYLEYKIGIKRPEKYSLSLYNTVDEKLKKEFDLYRDARRPHPIMRQNGIYALPYAHPQLDQWRDRYTGLQYKVPNTNIILTGAIDDLWIDLKTNEVIVVDYKATSSNGSININTSEQGANRRQMEIYQYLLRMNNEEVSSTAYFVFCNGKNDGTLFNNQLQFDLSLVPYVVEDDCSWVLEMAVKAYECLQSDGVPKPTTDCKYCCYTRQIAPFNGVIIERSPENNTKYL
jgi:hypothetical protein